MVPKLETICNLQGKSIPDLNVLVKTTTICPLGCLYCYEGEKEGTTMSYEVLEDMIKKVEGRQNAIRTNYIWHGAEPLAAGLDFFKEAIELQTKYGKEHKISNGMQSNGVLLTSEIADFLVENNISIGFSLDGPKHIHDETRPFIHGNESSFEGTMKAIEMMRLRGYSPGVIAVLTRKSLPYLDEIYNFFKETNLSFKINPVMKCGFANEREDLNLTIDEKVNAVTYLFDKWFFDEEPKVKVRYESMVHLIEAIFKKKNSSCDGMRSCQESFISIGGEGTIYPCSRFSGKDISYGNIKQINTFEEIFSNKLRSSLLKRYDLIEECQQCDYNLLCYSGCQHNAYIKGDIMAKDPNCLGNKAIYNHVAKRVREQLVNDNALKGE